MIDEFYEESDEDKSGTLDFKELIKLGKYFINSICKNQKEMS